MRWILALIMFVAAVVAFSPDAEATNGRVFRLRNGQLATLDRCGNVRTLDGRNFGPSRFRDPRFDDRFESRTVERFGPLGFFGSRTTIRRGF